MVGRNIGDVLVLVMSLDSCAGRDRSNVRIGAGGCLLFEGWVWGVCMWLSSIISSTIRKKERKKERKKKLSVSA